MEENSGEDLGGATVYVSFSAEINSNTTEALLATMAQCANEDVAEVHLLISTPGGNVMCGMNIYNVLRAMPFGLVTHNVGNVDSIGNAVFLAGERRLACEHSTFMFHGVGFEPPPGTHFDERLLKERTASVLADQKRIGSIIADRTNLGSEQIAPLFTEAQTKDSAYAINAGIIHEVADADVPPGSPIVALVFER